MNVLCHVILTARVDTLGMHRIVDNKSLFTHDNRICTKRKKHRHTLNFSLPFMIRITCNSRNALLNVCSRHKLQMSISNESNHISLESMQQIGPLLFYVYAVVTGKFSALRSS